MQTVNFNCPHCGNLMAVTSNLLGRNVRCPHCKHVVRAPAAAGEAPPPAPPPPPQDPVPTFNLPQPTEHHESIFGERHDEDVFGSEPPKLVMPNSEPLAPTMQMVEPLSFDPPPAPAPTYTPPAPLDERPPPSSREERAVPSYRPRPQKEVAASTPAFVWMLFAYAAVITAAAGYFGFQYFTAKPAGDHPFKAIPDYYGQYEKANRRSLSFNGLPDPKGPVPDELRVRLDNELVVGDLSVKPVSVKVVPIVGATKYVDQEDKTFGMGKGLVLTLRVKNLSTDTAFHPNDPAFTRSADPKQPAPYTSLEMYGKFFAGMFPWPPAMGVERHFVEGHEADFEPLAPGAERDTWVVARPTGAKETSGDAIRALESVKADEWMTWRVQLRRGIVTVTEGGQSIPMSATTVIGVEFRKDQVK